MVSIRKRPEALYESAGEIKAGEVVETRQGETLVQKEDGKFIIRRDDEITQLD